MVKSKMTVFCIEKQVLSDALECFLELGIITEKDGFLSVDFINQQLSERE